MLIWVFVSVPWLLALLCTAPLVPRLAIPPLVVVVVHRIAPYPTKLALRGKDGMPGVPGGVVIAVATAIHLGSSVASSPSPASASVHRGSGWFPVFRWW